MWETLPVVQTRQDGRSCGLGMEVFVRCGAVCTGRVLAGLYCVSV